MNRQKTRNKMKSTLQQSKKSKALKINQKRRKKKQKR